MNITATQEKKFSSCRFPARLQQVLSDVSLQDFLGLRSQVTGIDEGEHSMPRKAISA
jgi:hypothetical protein